MYDEQSPILGMASVNVDRVASFILSHSSGEYTENDIRGVIVPSYYWACGAVGVNPVLAIAQMIHETANLSSFWAARPRRNPAGIGVNGQTSATAPANPTNWAFDPARNLWRFGVSFASWEQDSIPAHLGRLLAYALPKGSENPAQAAAISRGLSYRPFPTNMHGSAPILKQLGKAYNPTGQGWANPGTDYGAKIAAIANRIVNG
jgi:hypothetical protein